MARKYLTPIDLTGLELQNFKIQNLSTNPSAYGKGHTYYNTTANELRTYNGTSWETVGGNVISGATGSRPAAGHAGRLYFDTTKSVLFFDNGTTWVQDGISQGDLDSAISGAALSSTDQLAEGTTNLYYTDTRARNALSGTPGISYDSSTGVFAVDYASVEPQLVSDGFAKTSDIPSFTSIASDLTATSTYLSASGDIIDVNISAFESKLTTDGFASQSDISTALSSYLTSSDAASTYLTISNASSTYLTQTDAGNTYLTQSDASSTYQTQSGLDSAVGGLGYIKIGDVPGAYITAVDSNIFNVDSGTLQLNTYVNDINGEIHLKKNEYWIDGDQTGTQYGVVVANTYSGHFNVVAVGRDLELEAQSGNTIWLNTTGLVAATYNGSYDAFSVNTASAVTQVRNEFDVVNNDGYSTIVANGNNEGLTFNHAATDTTSGYIATDGNNLKVHSDNTLAVEATSLTLYSDDNNISALSSFSTTNGHSITSGNNLYAANGIYAGGADTETDGYLHIVDAGGTNTFVVSANSGAATVDVHGTQNFYASQPDGGTEYGQISYDSGKNLIINANNNDLIITTDSGYAYIGNNSSPATRIATQSYVDGVAQGLNVKNSVRLASSDAVPLDGTATSVDGVNLNDGDRVLLKDQSTASENGIYAVSVNAGVYTLTRATDEGTPAKGDFVFVEAGTHAAQGWILSATPGTWTQFSAAGEYAAGDGIDISGNSISVKLDSDSLAESGSGLKVNLASNGGLDNDGGLYVKTANGVTVDGSGNVTIDTNVVTRKYSVTIGNTSDTTYTVSHNLGTQDVQVAVYDTDTYEEVIVDVTRTNTNAVTIGFAVAPGVNAYRVVVLG